MTKTKEEVLEEMNEKMQRASAQLKTILGEEYAYTLVILPYGHEPPLPVCHCSSLGRDQSLILMDALVESARQHETRAE